MGQCSSGHLVQIQIAIALQPMKLAGNMARRFTLEALHLPLGRLPRPRGLQNPGCLTATTCAYKSGHHLHVVGLLAWATSRVSRVVCTRDLDGSRLWQKAGRPVLQSL